jgi:alanyl-tRNA synthetase
MVFPLINGNGTLLERCGAYAATPIASTSRCHGGVAICQRVGQNIDHHDHRKRHCAATGTTPGSQEMPETETDLLFLRDACATSGSATVVEVVTDDAVVRLALDRTNFYPTGGGQPCDVGSLSWDGGTAEVVEVRKQRPCAGSSGTSGLYR